MSEPIWMKYVHWPDCGDCRATGVRIDPKTNWPEECLRCQAGRKSAIKKAQAHRRKLLKTGEL